MYKVVLCGISKYNFNNPLEMCVNDVVLLDSTLTSIIPVDLIKVTNLAPDGDIENYQFFRYLKTECENISENDTFIFYFQDMVILMF